MWLVAIIVAATADIDLSEGFTARKTRRREPAGYGLNVILSLASRLRFEGAEVNLLKPFRHPCHFPNGKIVRSVAS